MTLKNRINAAKAVLSDGKSRLIVLSIAFVAILAIFVGILKIKKTSNLSSGEHSSIVTGVPDIESIPGMGNPTREYVQLQEQQNAQLAEQALAEGKVALPTVVRTTYVGSGVNLDGIGSVSGEGCNIDELKRAKMSGVKASELKCKGCSLDALKAAGFSAAELMRAGFGAAELKDAGFSVEELKLAGFSAKELMDAGFSIEELKNAGFTAKDLLDAGFSVNDLMKAGFSAEALKAAGVSAQELLEAGFSVGDLFNAGFSAGELLKAGVKVSELLKAGYTPEDLLNAGVNEKELIRNGVSKSLLANLIQDKNLRNYKGCDVDSLQRARKDGVSADKLRKLGCSVDSLRAAGFTAKELKKAGFSAGELLKAGYTVADLRDAGFSVKELKDAGVTAEILKSAGFDAEELLAAGYNIAELAKAGFSAEELLNAGASVAELKKAGFTAKELLEAGVKADELLKAGFSKGDLLRSGVDVSEAISNNFVKNECRINDVISLYKQKVSEAEIVKKLNCTSEEVKILLSSSSLVKDKGIESKKAYDRCGRAALIIARRSGKKAEDLVDCGKTALQAAGFSKEELSKIKEFTDLDEQEKVVADLLAEEEKSTHEELQELVNREVYLAKLDRENQVKTMQAMMINQSNQLFSAWTPTNTQSFVEAIEDEKQNSSNSTVVGSAIEATGQNEDVQGDTYKAGSILFATLDTAVNSDENVPVMATIVSGKLKGTKVLGNFQRVNKKVVLTFTVLSIPYLKNSISFSAVAIDPETAKAALASEVDSHYLLRFGGLMGTSFLEGLGTAFKDSGSSIQTTTTGSIVTSPALTISEKLLVAAGTMASKVASENSHLADTPPTVKVAEGSSLGLLLTSDLFVPEKN